MDGSSLANVIALAALLVAIGSLVVGMAAIPPGNPFRGVAVITGLALLGAALYLFVGPGTGGGGSGGGDGGREPPSGPAIFGPSLAVSPGVVNRGEPFTLSGSGFKPNTGVSFRFESEQGISWAIGGFAAADGDGNFREQSTAAIPVCDVNGGIQAYYGQSADMTRDQWGNAPEPVTAADITVSC